MPKLVKTLKYALITVAVLIAVLLAVPLFLDAESYKSLAIERIEQATGRETHIGDVKLSLFPWIGATLHDVRIGNREGFSPQPFVQVGKFDVQVALLPLFRGRTEIKRFNINAPRVLLERDADGRGNWQELGPSSITVVDETRPAAEESGPPAAAMAVAGGLMVEGVHLNEGEVIWSDRQAGADLVLRDIELKVDEIDLARPVRFHASAGLDEDRLDIEGQAGPIGDLAAFDAARLPLQVSLTSEGIALKRLAPYLPEVLQGAPRLLVDASLEQRPNGERRSVGKLGLQGGVSAGLSWNVQQEDADSLRIAESVLAIDGADVARASGRITRLSAAQPLVQLRIQGETISRERIGAWLPAVRDLYASHPAPWRHIRFGLLIQGDADEVLLQDAQLVLNDEPVQLTGKLKLGKRPDVTLRLSAPILHVDPWLPGPAEGRKTASASPAVAGLASMISSAYADEPGEEVSAEPDLRFLADMRADVQMQIDDLRLRGLELRHLRGDLVGSGGVFRLNPLRFDLAGGRVEENASFGVKDYPVTWSESARIKGVDVYPLLKAFADIEILHGTLQMDSDIRGKGLLKPALIGNLQGNGKVSLRDGSIHGFDIAGSLRRIRSFGTADTASQKTDFSELSGSFTIRDGRVSNEDLYMASPLLRMAGHGTIDLVAQTLDYHVKPRLVGTLVGQGDTETARKGLAVPVRIHGRLEKPQLALDVDPMTLLTEPEAIEETVKGVREQLKEIKKQKPEDILQKGLKGLLPGLPGQ